MGITSSNDSRLLCLSVGAHPWYSRFASLLRRVQSWIPLTFGTPQSFLRALEGLSPLQKLGPLSNFRKASILEEYQPRRQTINTIYFNLERNLLPVKYYNMPRALVFFSKSFSRDLHFSCYPVEFSSLAIWFHQDGGYLHVFVRFPI